MFNNRLKTQSTLSQKITKKIQQSPQYRDGKFFSAEKALNMGPIDLITSFWRFLFSRNNQTPNHELPIQDIDLSFFRSNRHDQLNSTWVGHSSLLINISGYKIITDPVFEKKVSAAGPARYYGKAPLNPALLPEIDLVIISHDHYDHLNKISILQLIPKVKQFIVPLAVGKRLIRWGVPSEKIIEMDWWESFLFDKSLEITATPGQHFSGRGIFDRNTTLWASWIIKTPEFNIFFSGDSGYFEGFKKIGNKFGPFDMTFLECGAYDELWHGVHMFPKETVKAHIDLKGKLLHPVHWGTFSLGFHPWDEPMKRLIKAAKARHIPVATPMAGQTIQYDTIQNKTNSFCTNWWEL